MLSIFFRTIFLYIIGPKKFVLGCLWYVLNVSLFSFVVASTYDWKLRLRLLFRIVGLLSINCIGFEFKKSGVKGRGLYPLLSLVSHSCVSNARYTGRQVDTVYTRCTLYTVQLAIIFPPFFLSPHLKRSLTCCRSLTWIDPCLKYWS